MADENTLQNHPSLPPNFVSLVQLQEQWNQRKQKQQQQEAAAKLKELEVQKHQEFAAHEQNQQHYQHQKQGNCAKNYKNMENLNLGSKNNSNIEKTNLASVQDYDQQSRQFQQGNYAKNCRNMDKLNLGSVQERSDQRNIQFQQHQKQGVYGKNNRKMEKLNLGSVQEFDQYNRQYQQDKEQGGYVKNNRNMKKLNLGGVQDSDQHDIQRGYVKCNKNKEKSNLGRVQESGRNGYDSKNEKGVYKDKGKGKIGEVGERQFDGKFRRNCDGGDFERCDGEFRHDFGGGGVEFAVAMYVCEDTLNYDEIVEAKKPEDGRRGGFVKNNRNMEKLNLGGVQDSDQHDIQRGYVNCNKNKEKLNLGRVQETGRNGYDRNNGKGVYKDKGKVKIGEVGERQFDDKFRRNCDGGDFERCDGEFRHDCGGGGVESAVAMYVCEDTLNYDEIVEVKKPEDGHRGGLTGNESDLRAHYDISENLMKGNTMVETEECLERGKKVGDQKKGLSRASWRNQGSLVENFGGSCNVGKCEGVGETEEVLAMKENEKISDMGVVTDVKNEEQRHRRGYRNGRSKKGVSKGKCGNGRHMAKENGIQLDLKKGNGEKIGEGSEENIGGGESVAEEVVRLKESKHKSVGRKNINGRVKERTRGGAEIWAMKGVKKGANIIKNTVREKSRNNEPVEEIPVAESDIIAKADLYSTGSQINYCDNMVNSEFCLKTMEKIEIQKQELSGEEAGDNSLLMTKEAREKITRGFEELPLNIQRVGNGRKNVQYNQYRRFQYSRFADKQRNNGRVWVRKEEIAGAAVYSLP